MLAPIYKCICEEITHLRSQLERHWWQSGPAFSSPASPCLRPYTGMRPHARRRTGTQERASAAPVESILRRDEVKHM